MRATGSVVTVCQHWCNKCDERAGQSKALDVREDAPCFPSDFPSNLKLRKNKVCNVKEKKQIGIL